MRQIIDFFVRNKNFILFLTLFSFSLIMIFSNSSYHNSLALNSTNSFTAKVYNSSNSITSYFNLRNENNELVKENTTLKEIIFNSKSNYDSLKYNVFDSKIIKNSYSFNNNYLTIDKGLNDSISEDMGVVSDKGVIGITDRISKSYSRVISILNTKLNLNAKLALICMNCFYLYDLHLLSLLALTNLTFIFLLAGIAPELDLLT